MTDLSPTERTRITRLPERGRSDQSELLECWRRAIVAHVAVDAGDHPVALPVAYGVDPDGPDEGGTLYVHGSVAAGWMRKAPGTTVCVTVTALDGLVLARSGFHHSMNYRCAVVIGPARLVDDAEERARALDLVVDHVVPGRAATLRPHTRKELAATAVLAVPLREASLKVRTGGVKDEPEDVAAGVWAGVLPLRIVAGEVETDPRTPRRCPTTCARRARPAARLTLDKVRPMPRTLVLLKPDAVRRGLVGEILSRFEAKGLTIVAMEHRRIDAALADQHYAEHVEKDFYPPLRDFVTSGPLVSLVLEGDEAVEVVRAINGATDGRAAAPGTIRGDLSLSNRENLVHGSDSPESAEREIAIWFPQLAL